MKAKTTVVIPNYNGLSFLPDCLASLAASRGPHFEILIVDNASQDNSLDYIRSSWPDVHILELDQNYGFSRAVNEGIRHAKTPYVLLLNNDVKVAPDFVLELTRAIELSPEIFSVASRMIQMYRPDLLDSAGDYYTIQGWAGNRGIDQKRNTYRKGAMIFSACAGAAIYRKEIFEEIGYFDETHFAYLEDVDIGCRAMIYGYRNVYCPRAVVWHVGSGTSGSRYNDFKIRLSARNNLYFNYKNLSPVQKVLNAPALAAGTLVKYLIFRHRGFGKAYAEGVKEGLSASKVCRKVPFRAKHIPNYIRIEFMLIANSVVYIKEILNRRFPR